MPLLNANSATSTPMTIEPLTFSNKVAWGIAVPNRRAKTRLKPWRSAAPMPPPTNTIKKPVDQISSVSGHGKTALRRTESYRPVTR